MFDRAKFWRYSRYTVLTVALLAAFFTLYLDFRVRSEFEGRRFALPARIYARPLELHAGLRIAQIDVVRELQEAGYGQGPREGEPGWFANDNDWLEVAIRPFVFWDGPQPAKRVRIAFEGGAVRAVQDAEGRDLPLARLEPLAIGGIYPANNEDRVLVRLSEVPKPLVQALIANEDRNFYSHHGFDLRGIARAAFSFLRFKGLQGGSTLTQQLVKNFFLTPERTLSRKVTELFMAVLLEMHYDKDEILETYLNEIYLGQDRDRAIHGVGLASLFYFGKTIEHLTLAQFDRGKIFGEPGLEGAVVVTDTQSGEVQALVGGRDVRFRGFNRALDAGRPVGSLLKPAIYLTALAEPSRYTLVTPIDDGPFVWKSRGAPDWEPTNYDKTFHGAVPLRTALAQSYNAATARLGTEREMQPFASTLLGAVDLSPLEVAQMYQTIASGGFRTPLRAIREVTTQDGRPLKRYALAVEQAFPPEAIYLITAAMQGVVREGTGRSLSNWLPPETAVAGKTGTTTEQRDAWFAGFTGDRLGIVWIGYDDNRAARLSGAGAALPVWGEMMASLNPEPLELPFAQGSAPIERAPCASALGVAVEGVKQQAKGWLQRLFGR